MAYEKGWAVGYGERNQLFMGLKSVGNPRMTYLFTGDDFVIDKW